MQSFTLYAFRLVGYQNDKKFHLYLLPNESLIISGLWQDWNIREFSIVQMWIAAAEQNENVDRPYWLHPEMRWVPLR